MKIKKNNVFYNGYSQHKISELLKLGRTKNYSAPELAKVFNCSKSTILRALDYNNIHLPNKGQFKRKYNLNDNFFDKLDNISAYWLGFIAADGCILNKTNGIKIVLSNIDDNHLRKFLKAINSNGKIHYVKKYNSVFVEIYSKKIVKRLLSYGITPKKSLSIKHVKVPSFLMSHFIRGIFDGDGSITGKKRTHLQFMIAGNKPFLEQIQDVLIKRCYLNKVKIYPLKSKAFKIQYTGIQFFKILNFIYKNSESSIMLDRKYEKYLYYKKVFNMT
ncbi:hypothetical protein CMO89_04730 [Candidatus Woesearchaeota archaeon]|nr:hypothetical protein [Candidatus Woesearchaeota archaeon]|tara:strand:- start:6463 stop:7284 length:822 start_codon:yes stop_codon:yes gene_type:complete